MLQRNMQIYFGTNDQLWTRGTADNVDLNLAVLSLIAKLPNKPLPKFPTMCYIISHGGGCCNLQSEHTLQRPVLCTSREAVNTASCINYYVR